MMTIQTKQDGATLTLAIEGRVDTMTSPQLQQAVLQAFQSAGKVVLDFAKVPYISSAGSAHRPKDCAVQERLYGAYKCGRNGTERTGYGRL